VEAAAGGSGSATRPFLHQGKTPTTADVGNGTGQAEFQLSPEKPADLRLINPAKRCREARESSENRIFT
jgi:hypothetical protein